MAQQKCGTNRIPLEDGSGYLLLEEGDENRVLFEWDPLPELASNKCYRVWNPDNKGPCRSS